MQSRQKEKTDKTSTQTHNINIKHQQLKHLNTQHQHQTTQTLKYTNNQRQHKKHEYFQMLGRRFTNIFTPN